MGAVIPAGGVPAGGVVVAVVALDELVEVEVDEESWQPAALSTTAKSAAETANARMLLSFGDR
jgi:hypothetical protein